MPDYINHLRLFNNYYVGKKMVRGFHSPEFLFYVAYWLDQLPEDAFFVYAAPAAGNALYPLARFLEPLQILLIENHSMLEDADREQLHQAIADTRLSRLELIEDDFTKIWTTLSNVDFLLLDGPPNTTNFEPFSDNFIFMMHDIEQRLRSDAGGDSLEQYAKNLCNPCSDENKSRIRESHIPGNYKHRHKEFYDEQEKNDYGPHAWRIGRK